MINTATQALILKWAAAVSKVVVLATFLATCSATFLVVAAVGVDKGHNAGQICATRLRYHWKTRSAVKQQKSRFHRYSTATLATAQVQNLERRRPPAGPVVVVARCVCSRAFFRYNKRVLRVAGAAQSSSIPAVVVADKAWSKRQRHCRSKSRLVWIPATVFG